MGSQEKGSQEFHCKKKCCWDKILVRRPFYDCCRAGTSFSDSKRLDTGLRNRTDKEINYDCSIRIWSWSPNYFHSETSWRSCWLKQVTAEARAISRSFRAVSSLRRRSKICSQNGRKGLCFLYAQIEEFENSVVLFSHSSTAAPCFIAVELRERRTFLNAGYSCHGTKNLYAL